ncbi:hypothetical protein ACFVSN_40680 [Kitasatospora sp. NPDC057904]|uniref:hypothetical protein n=1 Tax=Kitasatospora sp. NPDC057904 TaxID=3346275 RepID=UPI0036DD8EFC
MADTSTQGRCAVSKALKELTEAGFYRVELIRLPDGTLRSEAHVYDTPQLGVARLPGANRPVPGRPGTGRCDVPEVKKPGQEPTLPADVRAASPAATTLLQVVRPEPRLWLGEKEAAVLAPLVDEWLERGSTTADLAHALLPGLPAAVHSPVGMLRDRLERKMPAVRPAQPTAVCRYAECSECRDPVPGPGRCRRCAGHEPRVPAASAGAAVTARGANRARAALLGARTQHPGGPAGRRN